MKTNSQLSTNEPKRKEKQQKQKLNKQLEQEQDQRNGHHMEDFQWGGGREEQWGKCTRKKKNWQVLHRWGEVKNGTGNRELKELICTTHGHELRGWGNAGGVRGQGGGGDKG